jgi:hypothetical protein
MFSETRYAMNGDLRVAYRASGEGERDCAHRKSPGVLTENPHLMARSVY